MCIAEIESPYVEPYSQNDTLSIEIKCELRCVLLYMCQLVPAHQLKGLFLQVPV